MWFVITQKNSFNSAEKAIEATSPLKCSRNVSDLTITSFRLTWDYQKYKVEFHQAFCCERRFKWIAKVLSFDWSMLTGFTQKVWIFIAMGEIRIILVSDLHIEALKHYTIGIRHESSLQTSFVAGALKTLRSLGQTERMYQIILR